MAPRRSWQFGLRSLIAVTTVVAMGMAVCVCPWPVCPLLLKAIGGMALFIPVVFAVYAGDWLERWLRRK